MVHDICHALFNPLDVLSLLLKHIRKLHKHQAQLVQRPLDRLDGLAALLYVGIRRRAFPFFYQQELLLSPLKQRLRAQDTPVVTGPDSSRIVGSRFRRSRTGAPSSELVGRSRWLALSRRLAVDCVKVSRSCFTAEESSLDCVILPVVPSWAVCGTDNGSRNPA